MKTKDEIIQFIYSEYDYYDSFIKSLQNLISSLDTSDTRYIVFSKTIVDSTMKLQALKNIIDFIDRKEDK